MIFLGLCQTVHTEVWEENVALLREAEIFFPKVFIVKNVYLPSTSSLIGLPAVDSGIPGDCVFLGGGWNMGRG